MLLFNLIKAMYTNFYFVSKQDLDLLNTKSCSIIQLEGEHVYQDQIMAFSSVVQLRAYIVQILHRVSYPNQYYYYSH